MENRPIPNFFFFFAKNAWACTYCFSVMRVSDILRSKLFYEMKIGTYALFYSSTGKYIFKKMPFTPLIKITVEDVLETRELRSFDANWEEERLP